MLFQTFMTDFHLFKNHNGQLNVSFFSFLFFKLSSEIPQFFMHKIKKLM